jgi:4-amino-4-deoxy-L-arabinose transferase-like glycosyltransferase
MFAKLRTALMGHVDLTVFVVALVVRLAWIATLENGIHWFDEQEFAAIARHLANGDGYVSSSFRANPTVAVYLGLVFRVFGENYVIARVGQCLMGAAACVLVRRIAATLVGPGAGLLSGFLLAVYPPHIFLAGLFYVDTWLTFFCALTVYLTVLVMQGRGGLGLAFLCGVSQGLTILTRPAFLVSVPGPILAWVVSEPLRRGRRALVCGVFLLGCAATVLPWTYRNYQVFGRPVLVASGFWAMLWRGNHELANGGPDDRVFQWGTTLWEERLRALPAERQRELTREYEQVDRLVVARQRAIGDAELALDDVLGQLAIDAIVAHPVRTVRLILAKVGTLFSAFSATSSTNDRTIPLHRWLAPLSFYPLLGMALVGAALGRSRWRELAPIYLLILCVTGVYALLTACTRFRLPLDPFLIILSSLAVTRIAQALRLSTFSRTVSRYPAGSRGRARGRSVPPAPAVTSASSGGTSHA